MTTAQKIALRLSQVRQRLNEISGLEGEAFTDEIRAEADTLQGEFRDLETRHRSALIAEGDESPGAPASLPAKAMPKPASARADGRNPAGRLHGTGCGRDRY